MHLLRDKLHDKPITVEDHMHIIKRGLTYCEINMKNLRGCRKYYLSFIFNMEKKCARYVLDMLYVFWVLFNWQISEEEITFLTGDGDSDYDKVVLEKLFHPNLRLLIVSEGSQGCRYYTKV